MKLDGKVAIITGAREGIGRAIAMAFAREGAQLVVASRNIDESSEVVTEVRALGGKVIPVKADVAVKADVENMVAVAMQEFGKVDILINNAGLTRPAMLHKMTEDQWDQVINVHLKGAFYCIQAVAKPMMAQKSGAIINVTSSAGLQGTIGQINYASAKGGINAMTKSAARELARFNIAVNAIAPFAETKMTETIANDPKLREKYLERVPMGRFGQPEEIAPAVVFLASPEASYITGQILCIDGGMIMR